MRSLREVARHRRNVLPPVPLLGDLYSLDPQYLCVARAQTGAEEAHLADWVKNNIDADAKIVFYDGFVSAAVADSHIWIDANGLTGDPALAAMARHNRTSALDPLVAPIDIATAMGADYEARWVTAGAASSDSSHVVYRSVTIDARGPKQLVLTSAQ